MVTYHDIELALKRVPVERLPSVYKFVLEQAEWPFEASPAEMEVDDEAWDELLATGASQHFLEQAAMDVRAEIVQGTTEPLEPLLAEAETHG
jgi:hypothetical protein